MSSPFCGFLGAVLDRLDPLGQMALIGEEGLARRRGDDLPTPSRDRRQLQILAEVGLEDDVGRHPIDRHEVGDIDELAESRDRLVEAGRLKLELGPRFPEIGRPGVELLDAALLQGVRLDEALQGEEFGQRIGDRRAGGRDQRPSGVLRGVDEAGLDVKVPGPLRAFRIDAFQSRLIGGEREFAELLHFVDDQLVDPDLGDRQHVVLARLQPLEVLFEPLLHPLDALAREPVGAVDALEQVGIGLDLIGDQPALELGRGGDELEGANG